MKEKVRGHCHELANILRPGNVRHSEPGNVRHYEAIIRHVGVRHYETCRCSAL